MSASPLFRGCAVALATPFRDGAIDYAAMDRLIDMQLSGGTKAIVACGTTGEPATMTAQERLSVVRHVVRRVDGRIPVIAGTGTNCTQSVIDTANAYQDEGVQAQLVVTPYYNKTTQEGLYRHYLAVAENTKLPIIIYNVPSRTGLDIAPDVLGRLAGYENFIGIKESSYDIPLVLDKLRHAGGRLTFYCGNDELSVPELNLGFEGVISVLSNLMPDQMSDMVDSCLGGERDHALDMQLRLLPLMKALFCEVSPIPLKAAMKMLKLSTGEVRLPLVPISEQNRQRVRDALIAVGAEPED